MKENSGQWGVGLIIGVVIGIFIGSSFGPSTEDLEMAVGQCEVVRDDYSAALEDASDSIDEANSQIWDGQSYAWASYDEMGEFLENLYDVPEADDPGTTCY